MGQPAKGLLLSLSREVSLKRVLAIPCVSKLNRRKQSQPCPLCYSGAAGRWAALSTQAHAAICNSCLFGPNETAWPGAAATSFECTLNLWRLSY